MQLNALDVEWTEDDFLANLGPQDNSGVGYEAPPAGRPPWPEAGTEFGPNAKAEPTMLGRGVDEEEAEKPTFAVASFAPQDGDSP